MGRLIRKSRRINYWPGFVDALSSLLMALIFIILLFIIGQFVLTNTLSGQDVTIQKLTQQISALANSLSMEKTEHAKIATINQQLQASLKDKEQAQEQQQQQIEALNTQNQNESSLKDQALEQAQLLNQQLSALQEQLQQIQAMLDTANTDIKQKDIQIDELGQKLNVALAKKVKKLDRYRSNFFGRLRDVLGNRQDIQIVGDRFVFSSEILFPSASAQISPQGKQALLSLAKTLKDLTKQIPTDIPWVLQVNGHTDKLPISNEHFASNWELSSARAIQIVRFLQSHGVSPEHLAASAYAQYQPIATGDQPAQLAKNRRIELKLTNH